MRPRNFVLPTNELKLNFDHSVYLNAPPNYSTKEEKSNRFFMEQTKLSSSSLTHGRENIVWQYFFFFSFSSIRHFFPSLFVIALLEAIVLYFSSFQQHMAFLKSFIDFQQHLILWNFSKC